jgi:hypothetical protein
MSLSSGLATIPGINGQKFTTKHNCKLIITVSAEIQINPGEPEQSILISTDIKKFFQYSRRQFVRLCFDEANEIAFCKTQCYGNHFRW